MSNYGPTFRKLRIEKGFSSKEVAAGILSVTALANFENGTSDIKFNKLIKLLSRICVDLAYFTYLSDDTASDDVHRILSEIMDLAHSDAISTYGTNRLYEKYRDLYQSTHESAHYLVSIYNNFSSGVDRVTPEEIAFYRNHIQSITMMNEFELYLMSATSEFFSIEELKDIDDRKSEDILSLPPSSIIEINHIYINQCFHYLRRNNVALAKHSIALLDALNLPKNFENSVSYFFRHFITGLVDILQGNMDGKKRCYQLLDVMETFPAYQPTIRQLHLWTEVIEKMYNDNNALNTGSK